MLFKKYKRNPIIAPDCKSYFERECAYNPGAIVHAGKIYLIYRAEGIYKNSISRLCLAVSNDGFNFKKYGHNPIIRPTRPEEKGGCEDPRITKINNTFYLTYVSWNGNPLFTSNVSLATSKDLVTWKKHGIIIKNFKAGALYAEKINGKYIMYVKGAGYNKNISLNIYLAQSDNLKKWTVDKTPVLRPRKNSFDNLLVEPGPAPLLIKEKLVLIHNTSDKNIVYRPSLAILDKNNPGKIIYRTKKPLLSITEQFEKLGKVNNVIFAEGLVEFKNKYFLYYGCADKCIGVATIGKKELTQYIQICLKGKSC